MAVASVSATSAAQASPASSEGFAWGRNVRGQLGDGTTIKRVVPVPVNGLGNVVALSEGSDFTLALLSDRTVMAWGENFLGELGNGGKRSTTVPTPVSALSGVTAISAGGLHSLALLADGTVMAWGYNGDGQLGDGAIGGDQCLCEKTPVPVTGLSGVAAISAGGFHSLALKGDGTVMAWGSNQHGQLGDGSLTRSDVPVAVSGLSEVTALAAGNSHSLALQSDGSVEAWGANQHGALGDGTETDSSLPVAVSGASGVTAISAGVQDSLALLGDGSAIAWGENFYGELGDGSTSDSDVPVAVAGLSHATAISAGGYHSLALLAGGTVMAWGSGLEGDLGNGTTSDSHIPGPVCGLSEVVAIEAGSGTSLALGPPHPLCPEVRGLHPAYGPQSGGTAVAITGANLAEETSVHFGQASATSVTVNSATSITAVSPPGSGVVDVTVTTPAATSVTTQADRFTYTDPPEFGLCVPVARGTGEFANGGCTAAGGERTHEWVPRLFKTHFTIDSTEGPIRLETIGRVAVSCKAESGAGDYTGAKTVAGVVLAFTGCELSGKPCTTAGAAAEEVRTGTLAGVLGVYRSAEGPVKDRIGLELQPQSEGSTFAGFSCGGTQATLQGSVIAHVARNAMTLTSPLRFVASRGIQRPESFLNEPADVLEASFGGDAFEQAGLTLNAARSNEEKLEVNSVV